MTVYQLDEGTMVLIAFLLGVGIVSLVLNVGLICILIRTEESVDLVKMRLDRFFEEAPTRHDLHIPEAMPPHESESESDAGEWDYLNDPDGWKYR